jgi:type I restriction enzyme S subunit
MSWELKSFEELGFIGRGKSRHRPRNDERLYNGIYPLIQTSEIQSSNLYINNFTKTYNEFGLSQSKLWKEGTLCLSIVGANTAETAILGFDACFPDSVIGFNAFENVSNNLFVKYFFDFIKVELKSISEGTARENLSLEKLLSKKREVPNFNTQKRIASILSTYDELIEINLKRIKLLEEAAQNIYKEWFVNFRFPNFEHTEFDNESGLPVGWRICPLNEFIDFKEGPGLRNWQFKDEGVPFLNIRMMGDGELDFSSVKYLDSSEIESKYSHFLLSEYDHIVSTSGTLGKVVTIRQTHLPLCLNTSIIRMRPLREEIGKWQLREILKSPDFINEMKSYATGSAQLNFGPKHLNLMTLKVPMSIIGVQFEMTISPIEIQICSLLDINQKLKEARDILLPRLMNRTINV